ncbi:hypothetical protein ABJY94_18280 [Vibrio parahaemolyticus]|uniref:hypothetical protein n=1 Tax=Vibrio parahaemolyticus TaxID=670 RepID=UPI0032AE8248
MNTNTLLKKFAEFITRLQAQRANELSHHLNEDLKAFVETLKTSAPRNKITFIDVNESNQTLTWHNAADLCRKLKENCAIHYQNAAALHDQQNGEVTEFDPYRMESEADEMNAELEMILSNVLKAVESRINKESAVAA